MFLLTSAECIWADTMISHTSGSIVFSCTRVLLALLLTHCSPDPLLFYCLPDMVNACVKNNKLKLFSCFAELAGMNSKYALLQ